MVTCVKNRETKEFRNPMYVHRVQSMLIQKRRTESNLGVTRFARIIFLCFYNKLGPPIRSNCIIRTRIRHFGRICMRRRGCVNRQESAWYSASFRGNLGQVLCSLKRKVMYSLQYFAQYFTRSHGTWSMMPESTALKKDQGIHNPVPTYERQVSRAWHQYGQWPTLQPRFSNFE
jgi:hypothetical protein